MLPMAENTLSEGLPGEADVPASLCLLALASPCGCGRATKVGAWGRGGTTYKIAEKNEKKTRK